MKVSLRSLFFLLFLVSGFCGLLYQVVWIRMAFASFGVVTPVLSVVLSVFMFGLFVGSWGAGRILKRTTISPIFLYSASELVIAFGAVLVPILYSLGENWLLPSGESHSTPYLLRSALVIFLSLFPWTFAMGTTFPFMMGYIRQKDSGFETSFSYLYVANVIGAMLGVLLTAIFLVELFGLQNTLYIAAALNAGIGVTALLLGANAIRPPAIPTPVAPRANPIGLSRPQIWLTLFVTGFVSMASEVMWTRAFTIVLQTQVYSFAMILLTYLLATWTGSLLYRKHTREGRVISLISLLTLIAISSFLPLIMNDPRLRLQTFGALGSIFPLCFLLGYLTPGLIDIDSQGRPDDAGKAYAVNIFGCILGPLVASYLLLPRFGIKTSLIVMGMVLVALLAIECQRARRFPAPAFVGLVLILIGSLTTNTYEERWPIHSAQGELRRDHTATVISLGEGMQKRLFVNGIGITHLTTITKVMAHFPLAFIEKPRSALVICFGMGTTFRSLTTWGIDSTAVELVPSVRDAFGFYFPDWQQVLSRPDSEIVVDDGRRYLKRTSKTFDLITLDPPPPVEAAGSSLLYSEEFYKLVKTRLSPKGILQQWVPRAEPTINQAITQSLLNSFPYVRVFKSREGDGFHFLASLSPIPRRTATELADKLPTAAKLDLVEWTGTQSISSLFGELLKNEINPQTMVGDSGVRITDNQPYNEYFLLRRAKEKISTALNQN